MDKGQKLSKDQLQQAAGLLAQGQTVTLVAKLIDCARQTLSRYVNHSDEYKAIADELIATFKAQGLPVAWRQLINLASAGNLKAVIQILNRLEGPVAQVIEERPPVTPEQIAYADAKMKRDNNDHTANDDRANGHIGRRE